jgi:NAD(P)H-quinone oxidoreductase subunit 5
VAFVAGLARLTIGFDRLVVNRLAEKIGLGSLATAEGLKFGVSGQLQSYVFTFLTAIILLFVGLIWLQRGG